MSERNSSYDRMLRDTYVTPQWVFEALYRVEPWAKEAWDCAPLDADFDFLSREWDDQPIATNPPYNLATEFCRHAIKFSSKIAFLLPMNFDAARSRDDLFANNRNFKVKYTVTKRIRWENLEQKKNGPSMNHAWFVWDKDHINPPMIGWLR